MALSVSVILRQTTQSRAVIFWREVRAVESRPCAAAGEGLDLGNDARTSWPCWRRGAGLFERLLTWPDLPTPASWPPQLESFASAEEASTRMFVVARQGARSLGLVGGQIRAASAITINSKGALNVPNDPIIPFIEGDGTGPDIWKASQYVLDGAVQKAYGGKRKISWLEVLAGEKAFRKTGNWLPQVR